MPDITETKLFSVKQLWTIGIVIVSATTTLAFGYFQLDAKANDAVAGNKQLSSRVEVIECLIRQQNYHQFYKQIPTWSCN